MSSWPENNITCPVCHDIYQNPVLLPCSHSLCAACWQRWRNQKVNPDCPVCRRTCPAREPPQNLALRNVCEAFSTDRSERCSAAPSELCSLHAEKLKLFCLNDQQPVCFICRYSGWHTDHSFRPLEEAAADCRWKLRDLLRPIQEKKELLSVAGENYNQASLNIELQFIDTERQIKDVFSTLQTFLKQEEEARLSAVRREKQQKNQSLRSKREAVARDVTALTDLISSTEEELNATDIPFLHSFQGSATRVQLFNPELTEHTPEALIDVDKHLNNLPFTVWDKIKNTISSTYQSPDSNPTPAQVYESPASFRAAQVYESPASFRAAQVYESPASFRAAQVYESPASFRAVQVYESPASFRAVQVYESPASFRAAQVYESPASFRAAQVYESPASFRAARPFHTVGVRSRDRFSVALPSDQPIRRYKSHLDLTLTSRAREPWTEMNY